MRASTRNGIRPVDLVVLVFCGLFVTVLVTVASCRGRAGQGGPRCASNLRQFGIALANYASDQRDYMPPVDRNYWHYLASYLGESNKQNGGSDIFRCPGDPYKIDAPGSATLAGPAKNEAYSYAANYAADVSLKRVALHDSNDTGTAFSYHTTGHLRRLGGAAVDTIVFIESWGECVGDLSRFGPGQTVNVGFDEGLVNRIMLTVENPAALGNNQGWHMRPAIKDYAGTNALTVNPASRRLSKNDGKNATLDHHWLLTMVQVEQRADDCFHFGRVNVLSAEGAVSQQDVLQFGRTPPGRNSRWTRARD